MDILWEETCYQPDIFLLHQINYFKDDAIEVSKEYMSYRKNPAPENKQKFKSAVSNTKTAKRVDSAVAKAEERRKAFCEDAEYIGNRESKNKETKGLLLSGVALTAMPLEYPAAPVLLDLKEAARALAGTGPVGWTIVGIGALGYLIFKACKNGGGFVDPYYDALFGFNTHEGPAYPQGYADPLYQSSSEQVQNEEGVKGGSKGDSETDDYKAPEGGGGVTDNVKVGDKDVSFGHGGRHLEGTGLSTQDVNQAIANDIVHKHPETGQFYKGQADVNGVTIEYTSYGLEDGSINVGTYYPK